MSKLPLQANTDTFVLLEVRERIHFLLHTITDQLADSKSNDKLVDYYKMFGAKLKAPVANLGRSELLISDSKQVKALYDLYSRPDFDPFSHMNEKKNDISGHLVFSLNKNIFDMILDESFDEVNYWGTSTTMIVKKQIVTIMLLLDSLLLTTFYEYGVIGLEAVLNGRLANTGQWWAWMELNKFSPAAYAHAGNLLSTTKNSNLDASINGASALFPTNITYARFSGFLRNSHKDFKAYNTLISKFSASNTNDFHLVITDANLAKYSKVLAEFRFHAVAVYTSRMHMFANSYVGYINMWRYNNSFIRNLD